MMRYIGNFAHMLIQDKIDFMLENQGTIEPNFDNECYSPEVNSDAAKWIKLYPKHTWESWDIAKEDILSDQPIDFKKNYKIEVIKQVPGSFIPAHMDPNPFTTKRYALSLVDYELGHVLVWGDDFISNYKRGDMWEIQDISQRHFSCNMGYTTRLMAQITVWD
jgi:hypothetical protein